MLMTRNHRFARPAGVAGIFDDAFVREFLTPSVASHRSVSPVANVKESKDRFAIELAAPGWDKTDFTLKLDEEVLTISAEKKEEQLQEGERYTRREFRSASFRRSFQLPDSIEKEQISANYLNGILTVTLPKKAVAQAPAERTIEVV